MSRLGVLQSGEICDPHGCDAPALARDPARGGRHIVAEEGRERVETFVVGGCGHEDGHRAGVHGVDREEATEGRDETYPRSGRQR